MPEIYNSNQLIRSLYKETSPAENSELASQLAGNTELCMELDALQQTISSLSEGEMTPDPTSISIIMEYSMKLHEPAH